MSLILLTGRAGAAQALLGQGVEPPPAGVQTPLDIEGLEFWYDADLSDPTLEGALVSALEDLSGNGAHMTQSGTSRGTLVNELFRAGAGVRFAGGQHYETGVAWSDEITFVGACKVGPTAVLSPIIGRGATANQHPGIGLRNLASNNGLQLITGNGTSRDSVLLAAPEIGETVLFAARRSNTQLSLTSPSLGTQSKSHSIGTMGTPGNIWVGRTDTATTNNRLWGAFKALLAYDRYLEQDEVDFLLNYLAFVDLTRLGHWRLAGDANDSKGTNHGTASDVAFGEDPIIIGGASSARFDPSEPSYVTIPSIAAYQRAELAWCGVVQIEDAPAAGQKYLVAQSDTAGVVAGGWEISARTPSGGGVPKWSGYWKNSDGSVVRINNNVEGIGTVTPGVAYRVAIGVRGGKLAFLAVDDTNEVVADFTSTADVAGTQANTENVALGIYLPTLADPLKGWMGDARLYDAMPTAGEMSLLPNPQDVAFEGEGGGDPGGFPMLEPDGGPGPLVLTHAGLGQIGNSSIRTLTTGGNARYSLVGTGKILSITKPPTSSPNDWNGVRCLARINNIAHSGAYIGGGWGRSDITPNENWDQAYDSSNNPRPGIHLHSGGQPIHDVVIDGVRLHGLGWDGVSFGDSTPNRDGVQRPVVRRCAFTMQRDDAVEIDNGSIDAVVEDCYFETFMGISARNPASFNKSSRVNTIQRNLLHTLPCRIGGTPNTIGFVFKLDARTQRFRFIQNIIAVPAHGAVQNNSNGYGPFRDMIEFSKMHPDSGGNLILWLGAGAYPYNNPDPTRFTIQTGSTAQNTWAGALAAFWATFPGHRFGDLDPPAP